MAQSSDILTSGLAGGGAGGGISDIVDDTTPQLGGDLDLNGKNIDFPTTANISDCLDEDNMVSDSATMIATQQSIKAYADTKIADVIDDTTPQLGGDLDCNGSQIQWSQGADVASGTALPILTDGNYFDVTGTSTITSIDTTGGVGTQIKLHFDGALTLTHHATNLILPGGANITTAAGDEAEFIEYGVGTYRCTNYTKASGKGLVDIDVADIADGTDGELITWNTSGVPTTVAVGTATHVLTSNGAGAAPTFQAAAGGGAWTFIESQTASTSSSINFTDLSTTYIAYRLVGEGILVATAGAALRFRVSTDNGSTFKSGASDYAYNRLNIDTTSVAQNDSQGTTDIPIQHTGSDATSGRESTIDITIFNPAGTSYKTAINSKCTFIRNATTDLWLTTASGKYNTAGATDAFQILMSSGNIATGVFKLYGLSAT